MRRRPPPSSHGSSFGLALGLAGLVAFALVVREEGPPGADREVVVDRSHATYLEDEHGAAEGPARRSLAALDAELVVSGGRVELRATLSAEGRDVDAVPGYAGVRGSNRVTARELTRIVAEGDLEVRTVPLDGGRSSPGRHAVARRGRVPERRLGPDGRVELSAETPEELVLELAVASGPLPPGRYTTEIAVAGTTRAAIDFVSDGRGGRIEAWRLDPEPRKEPRP